MKTVSHTILMSVACIVTLLATVVYAYMLHTTNDSVAASVAAKQAVVSAQSNNNREQSFMQVYTATANDWQKLTGYFVPSGNVVQFIESIEALGTETGATTTMTSIDADTLDGQPVGTIGKIHAQVNAQGSWSEMMRVLQLAEVLPYKVSINNVSLSLDSTAKKQWDLGFSIVAWMIVGASSTPSQ